MELLLSNLERNLDIVSCNVTFLSNNHLKLIEREFIFRGFFMDDMKAGKMCSIMPWPLIYSELFEWSKTVMW